MIRTIKAAALAVAAIALAAILFHVSAPAPALAAAPSGDFTQHDGQRYYTKAVNIDGALTLTGNLAQTAGAAGQSISLVAGTGDVTISSTDDVNIGTGVAQQITIGNETALTSVDIKVGTGNFTCEGVAASTFVFGDAAQAGDMSFGASTATSVVNIGTGIGATTLNLGTGGTGSDVITIGGGVGTVEVASGDWDISTTGGMSGIGALALDGAITQTGAVGIDTGTGAIVLDGAVSVNAGLDINNTSGITVDPVAANITPAAATGSVLDVDTATLTDSATAGSGTATSFSAYSFAAPTLAATNLTVTTSDAATVYIDAAPIAGTNETLTRSYALWVDAGKAKFDGDVTVDGTLTAPSFDCSATTAWSGSALSFNASSNFAVNVATGTSTGTVTLGGTGTQSIAVGNGAGVKTVALGSTNTTSTTTVGAGSGGLIANADASSLRNTTTGAVTLDFRDYSDTADDDMAHVVQSVNCTDASTGAEDCDWSVAVVEAGAAADVRILIDADAGITLGSATNSAVTLTTTGTGDAAVVLPTGAVSGTEILDGTIGAADEAYAGRGQIVICGDAVTVNNNTVYYGPNTAVTATAIGGMTCNTAAAGNVTEATADEPAFTAKAFQVRGMVCRQVDGNATLTYTLRTAAAATVPSVTCATTDGQLDCVADVQTTTEIASGATVAVSVASTADVGTVAFVCVIDVAY